MTSLDAPPESGARESVPGLAYPVMFARFEINASSPFDEIEATSALTYGSASDSGLSLRVEYTCLGVPSHDAEYTNVAPSGARLAELIAPRR
jgi:hypothetical protein